MNEQTTKLIEQLAQKLGTTAEYLWSVLLRQAPIDATIQLVQTIIVLLFGFVWWRIHKHFSKNVKSEHGYMESGYERHEEIAVVPMMIAGVVFAVALLICFANFDNIINGYFNPEYWALESILRRVE